jgi:hypothetical protein
VTTQQKAEPARATGNVRIEDARLPLVGRTRRLSQAQGILAPELHNLELARLVRDSSGAREDEPTVGELLKATPHGASDILRHGPSQRDSGQAGSFGQRKEGR